MQYDTTCILTCGKWSAGIRLEWHFGTSCWMSIISNDECRDFQLNSVNAQISN